LVADAGGASQVWFGRGHQTIIDHLITFGKLRAEK
jgi:hypothetical protein